MDPQTLIWLSQILYPNGRAFRMPEPVVEGGYYISEDGQDRYVDESGNPYVTGDTAIIGGILYKLHAALGKIMGKAWDDAFQILNDILPDNPNFTIDDAHDWYRRLGIYDSGLVSLDDMKAAITQRMSWPQVPLNKQNYLFIQEQLQAAGFDVYVYENRFPAGSGSFITQTPAEVLGIEIGTANFGNFDLGQLDFGAGYAEDGISLIANYIEDAKDANFNVGSNYRSTFFIAGSTITTFAEVPAARHQEFRQLLLKLKQAQCIGFLFVNYV